MDSLTRLIDQAMAKHGSKEWAIKDLNEPSYVKKSPDDPGCDLSMSAFEKYVCRNDVARYCTLMFDFHYAIPEMGNLSALCTQLARLEYEGLPPHLRPPADLPNGCVLSYIIVNNQDGTMNVLRVFKFAERVAVQKARNICAGHFAIPASRNGPWAWLKAIYSLLDRLPGHHVKWWSLEAKDKDMKRSRSDVWCPDEDELRTGVEYINREAPDDDSKNQQYLWILTKIQADSGSPISGWPETKVIRMAQNKSRATTGATSMTFFPFTLKSMKPLMSEFLFPMLAPLLTSFGIVTIGWPGVGKTPFLIALSLALGRYQIQRMGLENAVAAWRRAKSMDNFRHKTGQVYEGLILDDPSMDRIDAADLKSWLTAEEDQNCSSRYTDVKLVRNTLRAVSSNDLEEEQEPPRDRRRTTIEPTEFFTLVKKMFQGYKEADVMAILKRCVVMVFGKHSFYLRLPSQDHDAVVHRLHDENLHEDLFMDRDKAFYAKYKTGVHELPPTHAEDIEWEQALIDQDMRGMHLAGRPELYIQEINDTIATKNREATLAATAVLLPPSFSSDEESRVPVPDPAALPVACVKPPRRLGTFNIPGAKRRLTGKTSLPPPMAESDAGNHGTASASSTDIKEPNTEEDDPDEEAARALHD